MITASEVNRLGARLEAWLRMRVHPIAIKMLGAGDPLPAQAIVPSRDLGKNLNLCQAFSMVQRQGADVAMSKKDHWCFEPVIGLGLAERIPKFLSGYHRYPDSVRSMDGAAQWCLNMPCLPAGKYTGMLMSPVHRCAFVPDIVVMHINGMMASQMLIVKNWIDGKDIHCQLSGHAGCVYAIVPALLKQDCHIAIPCRGDRQVGMAQDDEIFFSFVPGMLPDLMAGIECLEQNNWGIPMHHFLKEEAPMRPKYMHMSSLLGMRCAGESGPDEK